MDHPITLCIALIWAVSIALWSGDLNGAEADIDRFIAYAESRSMGPYLAVGRGVKGELAILRGDARRGVETIKGCLDELHDAGYELLTTTFYLALVQGLLALGRCEQAMRLIDEAIALVERCGDRLYMPELLRVKGKVFLSQPQPNPDQAQVEFMKSLELSRREGARAWELRTAVDFAELLAGQQRRNDAKQLLQSAVEGFAEGSDTADTRAASRLLGTL